MRFTPILFSTMMVQAIMKNRKTITRREAEPTANKDADYTTIIDGKVCWNNKPCPYGQMGDVIWVRETWSPGIVENGSHTGIRYKADDEFYNVKWRPSIFMPKSACRIWLEIVEVRLERLQDISKADAIAEGIEWIPGCVWWKNYLNKPLPGTSSAINSFKTLWQSINGEQSWKENHWVWVIEFKKIEKPENFTT